MRRALVLVLIALVSQLSHRPVCAAAPNMSAAWEKVASWTNPKPPARVVSGNELIIDGVRCRLFGVEPSNDAEKAAAAKTFLHLYMKEYGDYYNVYNADDPVSAKDGVPLIWLDGSGAGGWAQETLVQAGLVNVDFSGFERYRFRVPTKDGIEFYDWQKCLTKAAAAHRAGKKPNITFEWPQQTEKK